MFSETLIEELAGRVGSRVLIATDHAEVDGFLIEVSGNIISVLENNGYGTSTTTDISVLHINFVRFFPSAA